MDILKDIYDLANPETTAYYNTLLLERKGKTLTQKNKQRRIKKALKNFQYFVNTYFKHFITNKKGKIIPLAKFHLELIDKLTEHNPMIAGELPRGFSKSTVFSLFAPIWFTLRNESNLVLLVSSSQNQATKLLVNIQVEFEVNEDLINDFSNGGFRTEGNWSKNSFVVKGYDTKFTCSGKGQNIRGMRYKASRVDFCIIDDIDDDQSVRNPRLIEVQTDWVLGSVFPSMEITDYKFIALSNRYAHNMVFVNLCNLKEMYHVKKCAIENNESIWKKRFTLEQLESIKRRIGTIPFLREYMHTPVTVGAVFKDEWLIFKSISSIKFDTIVSYLDPSYVKDGDFKACVTVGIYKQTYYIIDIFLKQTTMGVTIKYLYDLQEKYKNENYRLYCEGNFAQTEIHRPEFEKAQKENRYPLRITFDKDKKDNKDARIEGMSSYFERNLILFDSYSEAYSDYAEFRNQLLGFSKTSKIHDDGPDALESAINKLNGLVRNNKFKRVMGRNQHAY